MTDCILEVRDLRTFFPVKSGLVRAVDSVSFKIETGSTLAIVGESGSGKSVASLSILRLVPPPGVIAGGEIIFEGRDLLRLSEAEMRRLRGRKIAMIFQDPMTSLNPVFTVGDQIAEAIRLHERLSRREAWGRAVEMMRRVRIPDAERRARDYPHRLSGGMRQRVMIAMALSCNPALLIADEPTTALDVTIQAEILDLLRALREEFNLTILLVTHDLGVVAETADRVAVMYAGRIVEEASVADLFAQPRHPYTEGLLRSVPRPGAGKTRDKRLTAIQGTVPGLLDLPPGCKFEPRCPYAIDDCRRDEIPMVNAGANRAARCLRHDSVGDPSALTRDIDSLAARRA